MSNSPTQAVSRLDYQRSTAKEGRYGERATSERTSERSSIDARANEPSELPYAKPLTPTPSDIPVTHRQQLPLPRLTLSRQGSSAAELVDGPLGRKQRDPPSTNFIARFRPEMYPLPPSGTDSGTGLLSPSASRINVPVSTALGGCMSRPAANRADFSTDRLQCYRCTGHELASGK